MNPLCESRKLIMSVAPLCPDAESYELLREAVRAVDLLALSLPDYEPANVVTLPCNR
jgi:hypothetical protein